MFRCYVSFGERKLYKIAESFGEKDVIFLKVLKAHKSPHPHLKENRFISIPPLVFFSKTCLYSLRDEMWRLCKLRLF